MVLLSQVPTPNHINCELTNGSALTGRAVCGSMTFIIQQFGGNQVTLLDEWHEFMKQVGRTDQEMERGQDESDQWVEERWPENGDFARVMRDISRTALETALAEGSILSLPEIICYQAFRFGHEVGEKRHLPKL